MTRAALFIIVKTGSNVDALQCADVKGRVVNSCHGIPVSHKKE